MTTGVGFVVTVGFLVVLVVKGACVTTALVGLGRGVDFGVVLVGMVFVVVAGSLVGCVAGLDVGCREGMGVEFESGGKYVGPVVLFSGLLLVVFAGDVTARFEVGEEVMVGVFVGVLVGGK